MEDVDARMEAMKEMSAKLVEGGAEKMELQEATKAAAQRTVAATPGSGSQGVSMNDSNHIVGSNYSTRSPPRIPNDPAKTMNWIRRFDAYLGSENLSHILTTIPSTGPVHVISCKDRSFWESRNGVQTVRDHSKVWHYPLEATYNTDILRSWLLVSPSLRPGELSGNGRCLCLRQRRRLSYSSWKTS